MTFMPCAVLTPASRTIANEITKSPSQPSSNNRPVPPEPGAAELTLESSKNRYFLGEPFRLKVTLTNKGRKMFSISTRADYRGSNRALRFKIQATSDTGETVPPADWPVFFNGGSYGISELPPMKSWAVELWPLDYLKLTKPGVYTIRLTHDFGWQTKRFADLWDPPGAKPDVFSDKEWKAPIAQMRVEFVRPDESRAERIVAQIETAVRNKDEDKIPEIRDLTDPVFLAPLTKRAEQGLEYFIRVLGAMPVTEASHALLKIAEREDSPAALFAAKVIIVRLRNLGNARNPTAAAWDAESSLRARALGRRLIAPRTSPLVDLDEKTIGLESKKTGADLLSLVGEPEDFEAILAGFENALNYAFTPRRGYDANTVDLPEPIRNFVTALDHLDRKGKPDLGPVRTRAQVLLLFHRIATNPKSRPADFANLVMDHGADANFAIREVILQAFPSPLPPELRPYLMESLNNPDQGVQKRACEVAAISGDPTLAPELIRIIRSETNRWLLYKAVEAAIKLGSGLETIETLADRLTDADFGDDAHSLLCQELFKQGPPGGRSLSRSQSFAIQHEWKKWIHQHRDEIARGVRFDAHDTANLPRALFNEDASWNN